MKLVNDFYDIIATASTDDGFRCKVRLNSDHPLYRVHFPGNPVVPGVILCEIMAQGSVLLFEDKLHYKMALYAGMDKVRFKKTVRPGDKVVVRSTMGNCRGLFLQVQASAYVGEELCANGILSFMLVDK